MGALGKFRPATERRPGGRPPPVIIGALILLLSAAVAISAALSVHAASVFFTYLFGQAQGVIYPNDFLNYYSAGRLLLQFPHDLYRPDFEAEFRRSISGGQDVYSQFQNLPYVAALLVPLALLPFGLAYGVWSMLNLCLLAVSVRLVAPRPFSWAGWLLWLLVSLCYTPAQFALTYGQTSFVMLFGFCMWVHLCAAGPARSGPLWLLTWAIKPQLLPVSLLCLLLSRAFSRVMAVIVIPLITLGLVLLWTGIDTVIHYIELARITTRVDGAGLTIFALPRLLPFTGVGADSAAVAAACAVWAAVVALWWGGPRSDQRVFLQFAAVPVAAVLVALRAYAYELTLWLASGWLVLRYAAQVERGRWPLIYVLIGVWLTTTIATYAGEAGDAWSALSGAVLLGTIIWQYYAWGKRVAARSGATPPE